MITTECPPRPDAGWLVRQSSAKPPSEVDHTKLLGMARACDREHLPTANAARLRHCYTHLCQNLSLPCVAWYPQPTDENEGYPCTVTELIDPATGLGDKFRGIFCKVRVGNQERSLPLVELELPPEDSNYRMVQYCWDCFWNWR